MLVRFLLALSSVAVATSVAGASPMARNGQLLYLRPLGGNNPPFGRLFVASPDGTARDITPAGIKDVQGAAWSPTAVGSRSRRSPKTITTARSSFSPPTAG